MAVDAFVAERVIRTRHFRASHKYGEPGMLPKKKRVNETVDPAKLDNFEKGVTWKLKRTYEYLQDTVALFTTMNPGLLSDWLHIPEDAQEAAAAHWAIYARKGNNFKDPGFSLWPWQSYHDWTNDPETIEFLETLRNGETNDILEA